MVRKETSFNLLHVDSQLSQSDLLRYCVSLHCVFLASLSKIKWLWLISFPYSISLICVFLWVAIPWCFFVTNDITWNQVWWYSSEYFNCSRLFWLSWVFCAFIQILILVLQFCEKHALDFYGYFIWICRFLLKRWSFSHY